MKRRYYLVVKYMGFRMRPRLEPEPSDGHSGLSVLVCEMGMVIVRMK